MKLRTLLKDLADVTVKGSKEIVITGLTSHSQSVALGNLFFAKKGKNYDGTRFIPQAIASGATAVVTDIYDPFFTDIVQVIHPDVLSLEPLLAERFFRSPSRKLLLVGITGTNGKTTTSYLISHLFEHLGIESGLIGSIERRIKDKVLPAPLNTPDLLTTQKLLREMVENGVSAAVMEVSSHGLAQNRVAGLVFDVAVFTNLTQDHLDYHGTMEAYADAKAKLFEVLLEKKCAVVNADDPASKRMLKKCLAHVITYGIENGELRAQGIKLSPDGIECTVTYEEQSAHLSCPLIGRFNIYNCLAALGVALAYGGDLKECCNALRSFSFVPGRMERVANKRGVHVFVDYSHTEDSLKNALLTLKELRSRRIFTVFGCGGDRDRDKRPKMGRIAEELSDRIIVTSDNPRSEDPEMILKEIVLGLKYPLKAHTEVLRKEAIRFALSEAKEGDIVLIAGKGHETYQVFANETIPFDDREVAATFEEES